MRVCSQGDFRSTRWRRISVYHSAKVCCTDYKLVVTTFRIQFKTPCQLTFGVSCKQVKGEEVCAQGIAEVVGYLQAWNTWHSSGVNWRLLQSRDELYLAKHTGSHRFVMWLDRLGIGPCLTPWCAGLGHRWEGTLTKLPDHLKSCCDMGTYRTGYFGQFKADLPTISLDVSGAPIPLLEANISY